MRLLERFDQRTAAAEFLEFQPTLFFGVPTIYVRLLDFEARRRLSALERRAVVCVGVGAAASGGVARFRKAVWAYDIGTLWDERDSHEHEQSCTRGERRAGTVGLPLPGIRCGW